MTCFSGCTESSGVLEETANTAEITETASETAETKTETEISKTEITETAEITETEAEEEAYPKLPRPSLQGFDRRAADYVTALVDDHDFTGLCQNCAGAVVADMNRDGVPKVFYTGNSTPLFMKKKILYRTMLRRGSTTTLTGLSSNDF